MILKSIYYDIFYDTMWSELLSCAFSGPLGPDEVGLSGAQSRSAPGAGRGGGGGSAARLSGGDRRAFASIQLTSNITDMICIVFYYIILYLLYYFILYYV